MRPRAADYLQPGETVLIQQRRHPLSVLDEVLGILIAWAVVGGALLWLQSWEETQSPTAQALVWSGLALVTMLAAAGVSFRLVRMLTSLYTVTDERVYEAHGRFWFHLLQTTYDRVTDLQVRQSPLGRMLGFGTVTLQTAGTGLPLRGVPDPLALKRSVEAARTRFLASLNATPATALGQVSPSQAAFGQGPAASGLPSMAEDHLVWEGRPAPASLVGGLASAAPLLVAGIVFVAMNPGEPSSWLPGTAMILFGLFGLVRSVIHFATTRFEVRSSGLVVTSGWLGRRRIEATYEKVTDLATHQTMLGRLLGFGTIKVSTAGATGAAVVFGMVGDPDRIKATIAAARARRIGGA